MQFRAKQTWHLRPALRPLRLRLRFPVCVLYGLRFTALLSTRHDPRDFTRTSLRPRARRRRRRRRRRRGLLVLLLVFALVPELSALWLQLVFGSTRASREGEATCPLRMHVAHISALRFLL